MPPFWFDSRLIAPRMASLFTQRMKRMEIHSLQKTSIKLLAALRRDPESKKLTISRKLADSIQEHLWRLADLEK